MTRDEAVSRLLGPEECGYVVLDEIFRAFGFTSDTPDFATEVYYHPRWKTCGGFTARDDGHGVLTAGQRDLVARMLQCVAISEQQSSSSGPSSSSSGH